MKTKTRDRSSRVASTREFALASGRNVLAAIACWTSLLFDAGAAKRLAQRGWPADFVIASVDVGDLLEAGAVGIQIESSTSLTNLGLAYDFVNSGQWLGTVDQLDALIRDFTPLAAFLESTHLCDQMGSLLIDPEAAHCILDLIRTTEARWDLLHGRSVDLPSVARLCGLTEKTARMAAIRDKHGSQELATYKDGLRTLVYAKDAIRWLEKRPRYLPTQIAGLCAAKAFEPKSPLQLGALLQALRAKAGVTENEVARQLGLRGTHADSYEALESGWWNSKDIPVALLDVNGLYRLAEVLKVENQKAFVTGVAAFMAPYRIERQIAIQEERTKSEAL